MRDPTLDQTIMELSKFSVEQGKMSVSDYEKILEHCGCKEHWRLCPANNLGLFGKSFD